MPVGRPTLASQALSTEEIARTQKKRGRKPKSAASSNPTTNSSQVISSSKCGIVTRKCLALQSQNQ